LSGITHTSESTTADAPPLLAQLQALLDPLTQAVAAIEQGLVDEPPILLTEGGLIKPDYHPNLQQLRDTAEASRSWLADYEAAEREQTGIKNLRIRYNQVFGFFIEVTRSNLNRVPKHYQRRATVTNAERFITADLKNYEAKILTAEEAAHELEYDLFLQIRQQVADQLPGLRQTAQALAQLDVLAALAEVAAQNYYVKPKLTGEPILSLREARHPVVEQVLPADTPFVPNDCRLDEEQRLIVLTGPNMSGKSVYLRQIALAVLMAHMGSFVAAAEAHVGLTDRIFARAGASDDISQGRSTFLVEMSETAHILHHASDRSLIILDEVGRGTSTYDGLSLAWAVAEDIYRTLEARCLFATHFHELTGLGDSLPGAANYCLAVHEQEGQVIFLRRLISGGADRSYGIHVARLAGLPPRILAHAGAILESLQDQRPTPEPPTDPKAAELEEAHYQLNERRPEYELQPQAIGDGLLLPADDPQLWTIIRELYRLDIANLTPIEALMQLNRWQQSIKQGD
jgi:DNA mismatch repair protein MutS